MKRSTPFGLWLQSSVYESFKTSCGAFGWWLRESFSGSCGLVTGSSIDPIVIGTFENGDVSRKLKHSPYVGISSSNASIIPVDTTEKHKGRLSALKAGDYSITVSYQDPNDTESARC